MVLIEMDQEKKPFVHDTINLDEIRMLLGDAFEPASEEDAAFVEESQPEVLEAKPVEEVSEEELQEPVHSEDEPAPAADPVFAAETMVIPLAELEEASAEVPSFVPEDEDSVEVPVFILEEDEPAEPKEALPDEPEFEAKPIPESAFEEEETEQKTQKKAKRRNSAVKEAYFLLHDVVYLLAAVTLIFVFLVRLVGVKGDSMMPTLWNQDFLLLESNFLYRGDDLKYGDVVVLNVPYYEEQNEGPIVKRVIATEGQTVQIDFDSGAVYVDGVMLTENYILEPTTYNWEGELGLQYPAVVPENCIFVLGDNRNNSMDSRFASIGMIDERCVLGKVLFIAMPGQVVDDYGNVIMPRDWGRIGLVS